MPILGIDREKCINCDKCYQICPMDVFGKIGRLVYVAHQEDCMCCFLCDIDCPVTGAIIIDGRRSRPIPFPY
ncbi:MAG: 4Fe-4S binding protein [Chloroflexi bacterium]|nr:4Fe-4S binding protein [Chloroflexota bacterium]